MTLFNRISRLCDENGITRSQLETELNLGKGTISKWRENPNPNAKNILALAQRFNVSTDYLLTGKDADGLTEKDNRDISKDLESIMQKLKSGESGPASFEGTDIPEDDQELLAAQIGLMLRHLKVINKEKYNPNKNK